MLSPNDAEAAKKELQLIKFYRKNPVIAAEDLLRVKLAVPQQAILEDMWFKNFVIVTAGRGTGKCLSGDTLLFTSDGIAPIEELGNKLNPVSPLELTIQGIEGREKTSQWYYDGVQETNDFVTSRGYSVKVTDDHRLVVCNKNSELVWMYGLDIKPGDYVAISRGADLWSDTDRCTEDEATLMGLLVGAGCFRGAKNLLGFTSGDQEIRDLYSSLGLKVFGRLPGLVQVKDRCPNLNYYHSSVWSKLTELGLINDTLSESKSIPSSVMRSSKRVVTSFLRGLFEADGGVEKDRCVSYCTKSVKLASQVHAILLNLGIVCTKRTKEVLYKGNKVPFQVISITSTGIDIFNKEVGFLSSRKTKSLREQLGKIRNPNVDTVPGLEGTFLTMWERTRGVLTCTQRDLFKKYKNCYYKPSYDSLKKAIKLYPFNDECKKKLVKIVKDNYYFDKVASKIRGLNEVYDLVVPGTNSFVGNGFINHNTYLQSVFACLWALLYPRQKVGLLAPFFRQPKTMFAEVDRRWHESPLLQEATVSRPIRASDRCYLAFRAPQFRVGSVIEAVPLGDGCLSSACYLTLNSGFSTFGNLVKIDDFEQEKQVFNTGSQVWSNGKFRTSDEKYYNGVRKTIKITTRKGYSIEGTLNHKLKVIRGGNIVWVRLDKVVPQDRMLIDRTYRWHDAPEDVTDNSAYVLGAMIGDGCWTQLNRMSFSTKDEEFISYLTKEFGECVIKTADGVHWNIQGSSKKAAWLKFWGLKDLTYTKDKSLPQKILSASREAMSACISGLYDTGGHVQVSKAKGGTAVTVGFTNTSEVLVDQLQYILLHYGIISYKTSRDRDEKWNTAYELLITGSDCTLFAERIGFRLSRKQDMLIQALSEKTRNISSSDVIPGFLSEMILFRENNRIKKGSGCLETRHIRASCLRERTEASRADVSYFLTAYADEDSILLDRLTEASDPNVYYDTVDVVEEGECPTYDLHVPDGHEYCASGFYSHNSKIRGARYYVILADEFAQIPENIFNTVILPMGATVSDPMANVERVAKERELIRTGRAVSADFERRVENKVVLTSSAFYQFNHMYQTKLNYEELIRKGDPDYASHTVSYRDMPEGFLSEANIKTAKSRNSRLEFRMEYEAVWEADSAGVFKASLIEKCRKESNHNIALKGTPGAKYVLGADPARAADAFALCLIELYSPNKIVSAWEFYQNEFPQMAKTVMDICNAFNVVGINLDAGAGGGGLALKDLLAEEERWGASQRILDADDPLNSASTGRKILHLFNPSPKSNAEAVYSSLNLLEQGQMALPMRPQPTGSSEQSFKDLEEAEAIFEVIEKLLRQLMLIEVTESRSGVAHFDVPSGGGHASQKKDLYTSFILASKMVYDMTFKEEETSKILEIGFIENRPDYVHIPKSAVNDSMGVSSVPLNSWAFRKTFKPG